jgi:hypothetical protein
VQGVVDNPQTAKSGGMITGNASNLKGKPASTCYQRAISGINKREADPQRNVGMDCDASQNNDSCAL